MPLPSKFLPVAIETADVAAKNLAKLLAESKIKNRLYHGTTDDINQFDPKYSGSKTGNVTSHFGTFLSDNPAEASRFSEQWGTKGGNVMPVFVQAKNPYKMPYKEFDNFAMGLWNRRLADPDYDRKSIVKFGDIKAQKQAAEALNKHRPAAIQDVINKRDELISQGYDSIVVDIGGNKEVIVFNPTQIKSAIGNRGTYNPLDPDITKAGGGQINPIKTPREMLLELAEFPHMQAGKHVIDAGATMKKLVEEAIQKYIRLYKKAPPPEDVRALEAHAAAISQKPTIWHDPVTQARARHELATNPGMMNPEDVRDPFLTQAMTGRGVKGTRQAPFVADINDPNLQKSLDVKQSAGQLEDLVGPEGVPSVTPAADALAKMASSLEQRALSSGDIPLIDKIKMAFVSKNKRQPTEEELQVLIAEYNPMRHQYGNLGASIVTARPKTARGMQDWRQRARTEGVPESYLEHRAGNYPQNLQAELQISQGIQPGIRPMSDDLIANPNREYAGGHSVAALSPAEMQAMMIEYGYTPGRFKQRTADMLRAGAEHAGRAGRAIAASAPARVAGKVARPAMAAVGPAFAAMQAHDVGRRLAQGDYLGATNATISGALGGFGGWPGAIASVPFEYLNTIRDEERRKHGYGDPDETTDDYVSVMEGYK